MCCVLEAGAVVVKTRKNLSAASCKGPSQPAEIVNRTSTMNPTNRQKKKAENCWEQGKVLADKIDLKKATKKELLQGLINSERIMQEQQRRLEFQEAAYMELWVDAFKLKGSHDDLQKELVTAYKDRNEAIRRYNALAELGVMAKNMGIDLTEKLPEKQRAEWNKKYKFSIDTKVLESGRTAYSAKLEKRQSSNGKDFKKKKK
jgi:hypothetical protein|tara:strand:- start:304 stop:912 length:609 start_codon:yes stop_codon:yes gene_type:complete